MLCQRESESESERDLVGMPDLQVSRSKALIAQLVQVVSLYVLHEVHKKRWLRTDMPGSFNHIISVILSYVLSKILTWTFGHDNVINVTTFVA